jgi:hypothetical protein
MIIKSMSRKHPSFAQLIDYIEGETKLKSRQFSIHHNLYSRDREHLKEEFTENARHLHFRKNGVYLYHEVLSITRSQQIEENAQKATLQTIVQEYLKARAKNNLAYAVLHEETDNLHFHIVMSANEASDTHRKRFSKVQFANIQTSIEKWVLEHHPELEQKAVFHQNQTREERAEREAKKSHLSNRGEELKRRGGKTSQRDDVQERLADIFETARDPRHFADLMKESGFTLYTRGQTHGVTDHEGNKYRINRLGLSGAWKALDERMTAHMGATMKEASTKDTKQATQRPPEDTQQRQATQQPGATQKPQDEAKEAPKTAYDTEAEKRLAEMKAHRANQSSRDRQQESRATKRQDYDR